MIKIVLLALGIVCCLPALLHAQNATPPVQSLKPTQSACGLGSQSLRVCNSDLRSCNSICSARALDPTAVVAGCTTKCCNQFNTCLRLRGCGSRIIDCF